MSTTIAERKERLLDQLENPGLTPEEVKVIEKKLEVLKAQEA